MRFSPLILLILLPYFLIAQTKTDSQIRKIMFYNVENLYDYRNDSLTNDDEFTPEGERHWNFEKFEQKISHLAKTILAVGEWEAPAVIGLCEIENLWVLEKLVAHPLLKNLQYRIIHKDSPDARGIDIAMLYRKNVFTPTKYNYIPIINDKGVIVKTREILHVEGHFGSNDKIHFFVNHWPSRYGGLMETDNSRKMVAAFLKREADMILITDKKARIVCMGDFNDQPGDESLALVLAAAKPSEIKESTSLVNLSWDWETQSIGTIKYQQQWSVFDQFIVSKSLMGKGKISANTQSASIFSDKFLLEDDKKYTGVKPFRTYVGFKYNNGFSDHLPVVLKLKVAAPSGSPKQESPL